MIILSIFFFITAILYSSVGFGGGSTYLALMLIWDIPYYIFPIIALFCNIIVVSGNSINYIKSGNLNLKLLTPYLFGSIPFAFIGASISIEKELFEILLFFVLFIAGIFLLIAIIANVLLDANYFWICGKPTNEIGDHVPSESKKKRDSLGNYVDQGIQNESGEWEPTSEFKKLW